MKVVDVVCAPGLGGYYHWDLAALKGDVRPDGFNVVGEPVTPGFQRIIEPTEVMRAVRQATIDLTKRSLENRPSLG